MFPSQGLTGPAGPTGPLGTRGDPGERVSVAQAWTWTHEGFFVPTLTLHIETHPRDHPGSEETDVDSHMFDLIFCFVCVCVVSVSAVVHDSSQ